MPDPNPTRWERGDPSFTDEVGVRWWAVDLANKNLRTPSTVNDLVCHPSMRAWYVRHPDGDRTFLLTSGKGDARKVIFGSKKYEVFMFHIDLLKLTQGYEPVE